MVQQNIILEPRVYLPLGNFLHDVGGLALALDFGLFLGDFPLLVNQSGGNLLAGQGYGFLGDNVHTNVTQEFRMGIGPLHLKDHADAAVMVPVGATGAFDPHHLNGLHVFTNDADHIPDAIENRFARTVDELLRKQLFNIFYRRMGDVLSKVVGQGHEVVRLGYGWAFTTQFDQARHALCGIHEHANAAFRGFAAAGFGLNGGVFLTKDVDGLFYVTIGFDQGFFAVAKGGQSTITKLLDKCRGNLRHNTPLPK